MSTGFIRASATNIAEAEVLSASTGAAFVGTVTVYVTVDTNTQVIGTVGSGIATAKGNGVFQYIPSAAESDGTKCSFVFTGTGAIPGLAQYWTITAAQSAALMSATTPGTLFVSDLIKAALKRINAINTGNDVEPEESQDALQRLNSMMESWQLEGLTIPYTQRTIWTISASKGILGAPYTVGTGGDINVVRPSLPNSLNVRYQDTSQSPTLERQLTMLTQDAWELIPLKNLTSPLPTYYYYQPTYAANLGSLYLWMVPTSATLQGVLYAPAQIPGFGAVTDQVILPPGYFLALRDNLAVELATEFDYNVPVDPLLQQSAARAKAALMRANVKPMDMSFDPAVTNQNGVRYSIYNDGSW